MAQRVVTTLVSDISGQEITEGDGETVELVVRGERYSLDLTRDEAAELDRVLAPYLEHATPVPKRRTVGNFKRQTAPGGTAVDNDDVRVWAREHGYDVAERGRISAEVRQAYDAAH